MQNYKDDWGLFVRIDLETSDSKPKKKKYSRQPIIFIKEKDEIQHYLRYQRCHLIQSVVLLKSPLSNDSYNIIIKTQNVEEEVKSSIKKNIAILTTIISSGVFIFAFALSYRQLF